MNFPRNQGMNGHRKWFQINLFVNVDHEATGHLFHSFTGNSLLINFTNLKTFQHFIKHASFPSFDLNPCFDSFRSLCYQQIENIKTYRKVYAPAISIPVKVFPSNCSDSRCSFPFSKFIPRTQWLDWFLRGAGVVDRSVGITAQLEFVRRHLLVGFQSSGVHVFRSIAGRRHLNYPETHFLNNFDDAVLHDMRTSFGIVDPTVGRTVECPIQLLNWIDRLNELSMCDF